MPRIRLPVALAALALPVALAALALAVNGCAGSNQSLEETALAESDALEQLVDEVVSDADRNARAKELLGELERTIQIYFQEVREGYLTALGAALDYDASPQDLAVSHNQLAAARAARRDDIIALAMEARRVLTAGEWKELSERRLAEFKGSEGGTP